MKDPLAILICSHVYYEFFIFFTLLVNLSSVASLAHKALLSNPISYLFEPWQPWWLLFKCVISPFSIGFKSFCIGYKGWVSRFWCCCYFMERGRSSFSRASHQNIWDKVDFIHPLFWEKPAEALYFSFFGWRTNSKECAKLWSILHSY